MYCIVFVLFQITTKSYIGKEKVYIIIYMLVHVQIQRTYVNSQKENVGKTLLFYC